MIKKIAIIGAGGVGSNLAFNILSRLDLSELVLLDLKFTQTQALACDLEDTRGILDFSTQIKATDKYSQIKDSDIVIFSAGVGRSQGMTRSDLLRINGKISQKAAFEIKKYSPKSIVIAVTNPLDIITYLILKETGFPPARVIGMGSFLDTSRFLNILWKNTGISTSSQPGIVFGPHSKEMVVDFDKNIFLNKENENSKKKIEEEVKFRGAKIVGLLKDRSAVFGPALACLKLIEAVAFDKNQIIPVSVLLRGEYGLKNICLGLPCLINRQGAVKVIERKISLKQKRSLEKIAFSLKKTLRGL